MPANLTIKGRTRRPNYARRRRAAFSRLKPKAKVYSNQRIASKALSLAKFATRNLSYRKWYRYQAVIDINRTDTPTIDGTLMNNAANMETAGWDGNSMAGGTTGRGVYEGGKTGFHVLTVNHMERQATNSAAGYREGQVQSNLHYKAFVRLTGAVATVQHIRLMLVAHKGSLITPEAFPRAFDTLSYPDIHTFNDRKNCKGVIAVLYDRIFQLELNNNTSSDNVGAIRYLKISRKLRSKTVYAQPTKGSKQAPGDDCDGDHDIADTSVSYAWIIMTPDNPAADNGASVGINSCLTYIP